MSAREDILALYARASEAHSNTEEKKDIWQSIGLILSKNAADESTFDTEDFVLTADLIVELGLEDVCTAFVGVEDVVNLLNVSGTTVLHLNVAVALIHKVGVLMEDYIDTVHPPADGSVAIKSDSVLRSVFVPLDNVWNLLARLLYIVSSDPTMKKRISVDQQYLNSIDLLYRDAFDLSELFSDEALSELNMDQNLLNYLKYNVTQCYTVIYTYLSPEIWLDPELISASQFPELSAMFFMSGSCLLPKLCDTVMATNFPHYETLIQKNDCSMVISSLMTIAYDRGVDDTADIETVAMYYALGMQMLVRASEYARNQGTPLPDGKFYLMALLEALTINRLYLATRIMTEPMDIGTVIVSETMMSELTMITSGCDALIVVASETIIPAFLNYLSFAIQSQSNPGNYGHCAVTSYAAAENADYLNRLRYILKTSELVSENSMEDICFQWLVNDAIASLINELQYYSEIIMGEYHSTIVPFMYRMTAQNLQNENTAIVENWIRVFSLSSTLRASMSLATTDDLLAIIRQMSTWFGKGSRQLRMQASLIISAIIEAVVTEVRQADVGSSLADDGESIVNDSIIFSPVLHQVLTTVVGDMNLMASLVGVLQFLYDETSEIHIKENCHLFIERLAMMDTHGALNGFRFNDPRIMDEDEEALPLR